MSLGLSKVSMYTIEATTHKDKPRERMEGRSLDVGVPAYSQQKKSFRRYCRFIITVRCRRFIQ